MIEPTDVVYHTADDDRALRPDELEALIETEECSMELFRGMDPVLAVSDSRRFEARDVDATVRHPSVDPADAFIEVDARITLSLSRDRCQPVGADRPARPVSTAKAEAVAALRDTDGDGDDEDSSDDGGDTPETWESSSATTRVSSEAEEVVSPDADPHGSADGTVPSANPQSRDGGDGGPADGSEDDDGEEETKVVLRDGDFVEVPADDHEQGEDGA